MEYLFLFIRLEGHSFGPRITLYIFEIQWLSCFLCPPRRTNLPTFLRAIIQSSRSEPVFRPAVAFAVAYHPLVYLSTMPGVSDTRQLVKEPVLHRTWSLTWTCPQRFRSCCLRLGTVDTDRMLHLEFSYVGADVQTREVSGLCLVGMAISRCDNYLS